jgi:hypothetical protein
LTNRTVLSRFGALVSGVLVISALTTAPVVVAGKDGDVVRRGNCTARSDWKLKLSPENGRIEVEFEVDQNRDGQTWNVRMKRGGGVFWRGARTTQPPSGSFEVRRVTRNGAGPDRVVVRARDPRSGEVCRGSATFRNQ